MPDAISNGLILSVAGAVIAQAVGGLVAVLGLIAIGRRFLGSDWPEFLQKFEEQGVSLVRLQIEVAGISADMRHHNRRLEQIESRVERLTDGARR